MDLAQGHVDALSALPKDDIFKSQDKGTGFGASGGKFKAYNLGKGKGMSVLQMVDAMHKASGFEYKVEVVGRRYVRTLIHHDDLCPHCVAECLAKPLLGVARTARVTFRSSSPTRNSPRRSSTSRPSATSKKCAATSGTGSRTLWPLFPL
mgnify:FL=1|jgi:hypothetical protein